MSHASGFGSESQNEKLAEQLIYDYRTADLTPVDRALCDYAVKLTLIPAAMLPEDLEKLRAFDLTEEQICIATQVISYFNYINRVADALGVDPEEWMDIPKEEWLERKGKNYNPA